MLEGKTVLITGGTGSLGQALTKRLLQLNVGKIRIFSRNEEKQIQMESQFADDRLRFFLGDVRDPQRLDLALDNVDIVFHAAALKHVPKIEYNPFEAVKTNIIGSQNVIDSCLRSNVEKAVCIGTDKAVSPLNTYGATKLLMEKLFVAAGNYSRHEKYRTKFTAIRYGNVFGSSSSVVPKFIEMMKKKQKIPITDLEMTRFSITMNEALDFILNATKYSKGSEIFIPKLKSYNIMDLYESLKEIFSDAEYEIVGIRPGEKLHEILINRDEIRYSWEINDMYMIINPFDIRNITVEYSGVKKIACMIDYSSDNVGKISQAELKQIIQKSCLY